MEKVAICHACGRTVDSAYAYCPWCGTAAETDTLLAARIDSVFEQVEAMQKGFTDTRIHRMENELGELEEALSLLLAGSHPQ